MRRLDWREVRRRRLAGQWAILLTLFVLGSGRVEAEDMEPVTVPMLLHGVHIFVDATVNDKPVTLVLDTGAGGNVITPQAAKRLELTPEKGETGVLGAGGTAASVLSVKIGKLGIGTSAVKDQTAYLIPLPDAIPCDGLLGTPFLQQWVVTIDYAQSRLTLTPRKSFTPPTGASAFPIRFHQNTPHIQATADGYKGWFKVDTGADSMTLFGPFVAKNHLRGKYSPSLQTVTGRGVGGLIYGDIVRLPEFVIGKFRFAKPVTDLSRQTQGVFADTEIAGNLGGEIWKRFTVTLDYINKKVYLAKNALYDKPFIGNRSGLGIDYEKGVNTVRSVIPNSPASEAGIKEGDTVLAIDDMPIEQIKPWDVREILRHDPGTKIRLRLRSAEEPEREVTLTLRELL